MEDEAAPLPRFALTIAAIGQLYKLYISPEEYKFFKESAKIVANSYFMEEKFDVLMRNFLELESDLASRTVRVSIKHLRSEDFSEDKTEFNRLITNFLSSARMYLDQRRHHISEITERKSHLNSEIINIASEHYDQHFSYRLMEALRNYSQHKDLPIRGLSYHHRWIERKDLPNEMESNVSIEISTQKLLSDSSFKSRVRLELKNEREYIDIKHHIRKYTECISDIHTRTTGSISEFYEPATIFLNELNERFCKESGIADVVGLALVSERSEFEYDIIEYFPKEVLRLVEKIRLDWRTLNKLSHRVISTRARHLQSAD